jgi:hypothetical protein
VSAIREHKEAAARAGSAVVIQIILREECTNCLAALAFNFSPRGQGTQQGGGCEYDGCGFGNGDSIHDHIPQIGFRVRNGIAEPRDAQVTR